MTTAAVRTTCPYCGVGCGIAATPNSERTATIRGDLAHPANRGKLCSKGTHLGETIGLEGRLLTPMIGDAPVEWDEALTLVAHQFRETIARHGPDSVAFYVSGQLLTEDYYVANKLMKGFIGTANIDTNSRLCMASAVAAHTRAFGEDVVACTYEDLDAADLIVLVGSNTAWCHPVVWQRIEAARETRGARLVVIDPRRTETAQGADLHLPLKADSDTTLFAGLLAWCRQAGVLDAAYLSDHVTAADGFWETLDEGCDLWSVARACDLPLADVQRFFELFAATNKAVTLFSQGVNQSVRGTDKGNAIINVHLATGRIGKPGAGPFSITGQPNAMGGREVGGLASMLAAHMGFSPAERDRVQRFWNSPAMAPAPGLKAVDLFRAVGDGRIKALWIMATNPAVSMPDAGAVRAALAACPFVVVSDMMADTDTGRFAHVRLPASAWGEKDGTVTNSARMISRQRAFLPAPEDARPDWWIINEVGRRMGFGDAFAFASPAAIFREHCALTAFENDGARRFNLGAWQQLGDADYDTLEPFIWGGAHPFENGRFSHPDGRARLVAPALAQPLASAFVLNTGRYRDQWHTMTRTGLSPRLSLHRPEPLVDIHPEDAAAQGLADGALARVTTAHGAAVFRVRLTADQRKGELFVPMHWSDRLSNAGRTGALAAAQVDPVSGQPGFKATAATITPVTTDWTGFLVSRTEPDDPAVPYWTRSRSAGGWIMEMAGIGDPASIATRLLPGDEVMTVSDPARGTIRRARMDADGRLAAALFVSTAGVLPGRGWIAAQLEEAHAAASAVLAGRAPGAVADEGPVVCVCFNVGLKRILATIAEQGLTSVAEVGTALSAGTNCGSCRPAIQNLFAEHREAAHA